MTETDKSAKIIIDQIFFRKVDTLLNPFDSSNNKHLVLGVSGGPDSMILSYLLFQYSKIRKLCITAVIIDHRLRHFSWKEALITRKRLNSIGLKSGE